MPRTSVNLYLLIAILALCAAAKPILYDTLDPDTFWHLRVADQLRQDGIGPLLDNLSFASDKTPWTPYSWLAELAMKATWDTGGYRAALLVQAMLSALFVFRIAITASTINPTNEIQKPPSALSVILATAFAAFLALPYLSFRPATLAIVVLAASLFLIHRDRIRNNQTRAIWLIIPITALLANIHLFVFLIPLWLLATVIGEKIERRPIRKPILLLVFTLLACLATPMLPGMLRALLHYQFHDPMVASHAIAEMQPFWHGTMGTVSAILVASFFLLVIIYRHRLNPTDWVLLFGSTTLLFLHGRYAPLFAITAVPLLAKVLPQFSDRPLTQPILVGALSLLLLIGLARVTSAFPSQATSLSQWLNRQGPDAPGYPTLAADFLEQHIPAHTGHLLNEFTWGGYLEWRVGDRYQVLLDGRTQLYSSAFWQATCLGTPDQLQTFLATQSADAAILPITHSHFEKALLSLGWKSIYTDDRAQVLIPPHSIASARF